MWIALTLLNAFSETLRSIFCKRAWGSVDNPILIVVSNYLYALPLVLILAPWVRIVPAFGQARFWLIVVPSILFHFAGMLLFIWALKLTDASLAIPLYAVSPVFLLVNARWFLGETASSAAIAGIVLVIVGVYVLGISQGRRSLLLPILRFARDRGALLAIAAAFVITFNLILDRMALRLLSEEIPTQHLRAISYVTVWFVSASLLSVPLLLACRSGARRFLVCWRRLLPIGLTLAVCILLNLTAFMLKEVAYVIAVKRSSAVFGVVLGALFFKEKNIKTRLLGAAIVTAGVVIVCLAE